MFVTTAFVANVIVRDDDTGYGPIVRATRISKFDYLMGRFIGAFGIAALAFIAVPLGLFVGTLMPWLDPETLGPNRLNDYLFSYFVIALPNLLITSALFFALATATRSMMATYMGVVVFLVVYFVGIALSRDRPELERSVALFEPFGVRAIAAVTRYWTAAERNLLLPELSGPLLDNRLLWIGVDLFGTSNIPVTRSLIPILEGAFNFIPLIIAIYYAGELVWRERDRKMNEIIDATPLPNWAYVVPKTAAVALVLFATLMVGVATAMLVQLLKGYTNFELGKYLVWFVLPEAVDLLLLAILAVFVQALSPNKYVGWGIMVLFIVSQIIFGSLGLDHVLYNYGATPETPLSDLNGAGVYWEGAWLLRLYWAAFATILLVVAHLLWRRGTETRLKPRLKRAPRRLAGAPGVIAGVALALFLATGTYAFYNTNVLNDYRTSLDDEEYMANFEKKYLANEKLAQPSISDVKLDIALYPGEGRALTKGRYVLTNLNDQAVRDIHVRATDRRMELKRLDLPGARLVSNDEQYGYRIYRLEQPMAPGERREMSFETLRERRGFPNRSPDTRLVENGTFLNNFELAPAIGMDRTNLLQDRTTRRKYGLSPELRPAKLEDLSATSKSYFGGGWATADITISTIADQTPIAPGKKVSDVRNGGRRTARFVSDAPILTFFSVQSARYAERHRQHAGVDLGIYYHPGHDWNVDRMLDALQASLDYYQANFGPYQFDQARIIEFPGYDTFAQAFANTMPYSESIGFVADNSDPDEIDYVTYVTAHELGHQYWAHQIIGANMQGGTMLSETLAQYSALMVMKKLYGEDKIRRFLKYELDRYLRDRGGEAIEEQPLGRVENQQYIHYRKGSLAMYLLQERLGEDAVNRALRTVLERYKFKGAPYPRSIDLIQALKVEAKTPEQQALVTDLFERITLYDLKVQEPTAVRRADGKWEVSVPVEARKLYADGKGNEKEAAFAEAIEVGLFTAEPGRGAFSRNDVIRMDRQRIRSGKQILKFVTDKKPTHAGVDPYNFYIDRNSADNVVPIA